MKRILTGLAAGGVLMAGTGAALADGPAYAAPHKEVVA